MRPFCLITVLFVAFFLPAHAGHKPPTFHLGIHIQTTGEGQSNLEAIPVQLPPNGEQILIRTLPECTERDLVEVTQDKQGLRMQFNHVGQVNLSAVTAQNPGRILVVMFDGKPVYAPVIDEQITTGELDIPLHVTAAELKIMQDQAAYNVRQIKRT